MRCAQCTAGIAENFALTTKQCEICYQQINLCPRCSKSKTTRCDRHVVRKHICLSKCLHECVEMKTEIKSKKRKVVKTQKINILNQLPISFII